MKLICLAISFLFFINPMAQPLIHYNMPKTSVICPVIIEKNISQVEPIVQWNPTVNICTMTRIQ